MNTANNKRRRDSQQRMEKAFVQLLQEKEINQISVTGICKQARVNRSTFYANYLDIYDLADAVKKQLEKDVIDLYTDEREQLTRSVDFLKLLHHMKENQLFYKTYFKLNRDSRNPFSAYEPRRAVEYYDNQYIEYHIEFFQAGFNAVVKKWLNGGCAESPEEIDSIIKAEYKGK